MDAAHEAEIAQERREECRRSVRRYLAERPGLSFHPRIIQRRICEGYFADFTVEDVQAALAFLVSDQQVAPEHDGLGATQYYKATSKGILHHERRL